MRKSVIFTILAILLVFTSILAPMPDWLTNINITGSGGQLGLQRATAADLSPVTVATTTSDNTLLYPSQRKVLYAASRFWLFYDTGTVLQVASSLDGNTWSTSGIDAGGYGVKGDLCVWYDGTYFHLSRAIGGKDADLWYRRGLPNDDGTIAWSASWQKVADATAVEGYGSHYICTDNAGYPVISYAYDNGTTVTPYVIKSNQNDGTWTSDNFNTQLSSSASDSWNSCVLPMDAGDLIAIYAQDGATVKSKFYDGSWNSENATTALIEAGDEFSAVVDSDYTVHLVFNDSSEDIQYTTWTETAGAWDTEEEIYDGTSTTKAPVLSKTLDGNLYCFWMGDNVTDHIYYKAQTAGTWDTTRTDWLTESDITDNASISVVYEQTTTDYIPVVWLTGSSPYNVRFGALELYDNTSVSITVSPTAVNGNWAYLEGGGSPTQYLREDKWYTTETGITWGSLKFILSNNGTVPCDVLISSDNWSGIGKTWYLSDTATPGVSTIGLKAGIVYSTPGYFLVGTDNASYYPIVGFTGSENETAYVGYDFSGTSDYTIVVKRVEPYNYLTTNLCATCSVWFGFKILLPTSQTGNAEMTGRITLTGTVHV